MRLSRRFLFAGAATISLLSQFGAAHATTLYLKGDVVYRERMALPETAQVEVVLADVSLADAPATIIASTSFVPNHSSPIPYELKFDSGAINPKHHYALQAKISVGEQLLFTTTTNHAVFAGDENDTQIFVERTSSAPETANRQQLVGSWVINEIDGKKPEGRSPLTIMFSSDGRAAVYAGCNNMSAEVKIDNRKMNFGLIMSTQMACDEVLMKQEEKVSKILSRVQNYELAADGLVLLDAQSKPIIKLTRG